MFLAIPHLHAFDAGSDLLAVRADILHHRRADGAGNAGKTFDALQAEADAMVDEIIPIATRFGVDAHDTPIILRRRRSIQHIDGASRVPDHHSVEWSVVHEHIGSAADHAQRLAFGICALDGFDDSVACGRLQENGYMPADTDGGEICKTCHNAPE